MTEQTATVKQRLRRGAALATIILTATAFWLSYQHLATVAASNGLGGVRGWAWPAVVDLFVMIGEILMLAAAVDGDRDWFALTLTLTGSGGSIALNVAGVGEHAHAMTYCVAATPPVAALLAFTALTRQAERTIVRHAPAVPAIDAPAPPAVSERASEAPPADAIPPTDQPPVPASSADRSPSEAADGSVTSGRPNATHSDAVPGDGSKPVRATAATPTGRPKAPRSVGNRKAPRRSLDKWVELTGPILHAFFKEHRRQPTANEFAAAIKEDGLGVVSDTRAKNIRNEILDRTELPALD